MLYCNGIFLSHKNNVFLILFIYQLHTRHTFCVKEHQRGKAIGLSAQFRPAEMNDPHRNPDSLMAFVCCDYHTTFIKNTVIRSQSEAL